jgi:peptide/nickel transport system substrate-binding protein
MHYLLNCQSRPLGIVVPLFAFLLVLVVACGGAPAAPDPTAPFAADPTPVAEVTSVPESPDGFQPTGTLNVGLVELGTFGAHPQLAVNPALFVSQNAPIVEALALVDINQEIQGWLAESWSLSDDFTTWTFKLREGVQFHKGYGEMTAEDVIWSYTNGWLENTTHVRYTDFQAFWQAPEGYVEAADRYTVVVNTGEPLSEAVVLQNWMTGPGGSGNWVTSKMQSEELGPEVADRNIAATGSWEISEHRTSQFWRMRAVENHWRQTPYFEELVFWELPEETSRLAGFQTGNLDTFQMAFDSISAVESVAGARLMSVPGAIESSLFFYGNYLAEEGTAYDPDLPWVSASVDTGSEEWRRAKMVREALSIAVDREAIIETLLWGFARPLAVEGWGYNEHQLGDRRWEYNPERARELLAEAGYPDGFRITLTPGIRGAPAEVEACQAIATMWNNELGLDVHFQNIPYETFRPQRAARSYLGANCQAASARLVVGAITQLASWSATSRGVSHPWLDEIIPQIAGAVDPVEREQLEAELGAFLFDNALAYVGLYSIDAVWPVGTRIEEWTEHVKTRDLRGINGYEYIQPRQ